MKDYTKPQMQKSQPKVEEDPAKPMTSVPSMFTFYGCGLSMFGKRDVDADTGIYTKNYVITLVFIPVFVLSSYRVKDAAGGGWYYFSKLGMSKFSKIWNIAIAVIAVSLFAGYGLSQHYNSPEYKAKQQILTGDKLFGQEKYQESLGHYTKAYPIALKDSKMKSELESKYVDNVTTLFQSSDAADFSFAAKNVLNTQVGKAVNAQFPNLKADILKRADSAALEQPAVSLELLKLVETIAGTDSSLIAQRIVILEKIAGSQNPLDLEVAESLSKIYEDLGEYEKIYTLLQPLKNQLSDSEMTRRLASCEQYKGNYSEAIRLLDIYTEKRKTVWISANANINSIYQQVYDREVSIIQNNKAPQQLYTRANNAKSDEDANVIYMEYLSKRVNSSPEYKQCLKKLEDTANVPNALLDKGIAHLRYAQSNPDVREAQLKLAEATLLSIQSYAGESEDYKLFLGQVYYWLGKNDEGKKQFLDLEKEFSNNSNLLLSLASTLREVGKKQEAAIMAEKSYAAAATEAEKYEAASFRAIVATDNEEAIEWLEKADTESMDVQINLFSKKGAVAAAKNENELARSFYQKAINGYKKLPDSSATLNNCALVYFSMFYLSGNIEDYDEGLNRIDQALKLTPNDPTLYSNAFEFYQSAAAYTLLKDRIEPKLLNSFTSFSGLNLTYDTSNEYEAMIAKLKNDPYFKKSSQYLDRALSLAPQNYRLYSNASTHYGLIKDVLKLEQIYQLYSQAQIDTTHVESDFLESKKEYTDAKALENYEIGKVYFENKMKEVQTKFGKAICRASLISNTVSSWPQVEVENIDSLLQEAKNLYQKNPCSMTHRCYTQVLSVKSHQEIAAIYPEYLDILKKSDLVLSRDSVLFLFVKYSNLYQKSIVKLPSIKKYKDVSLNRSAQFKPSINATNVAWAQLIQPEKMDQFKQDWQSSLLVKTSTKLNQELYHYLADTKLNKCYKLLAEGKEAEAKELYEKITKEHPEVPFFM